MAKQEKNQELIDRAKHLNHIPWCEQYEKMISGMLYDAWCEELSNARFRNRRWCHKYNYTFPSNEFPSIQKFDDIADHYMSELRQCLGRIGEESFIEPPFRMDYGANISVGERFYANFNLTILDCSLVHIGDRCMFGPNVSLYTATHETALTSRRQNVEFAFPITIGDDVWLGGNVTVLPGVTIGDGSVVAAGSIVTKDIPPYSVVKGSPARVFKEVDPEDRVDSSSGRKSDQLSTTTME